MSNIMKKYRVTFTVHGETKVKTQIVNATSKKDVKSSLLPCGYDVDEIVTCNEIPE